MAESRSRIWLSASRGRTPELEAAARRFRDAIAAVEGLVQRCEIKIQRRETRKRKGFYPEWQMGAAAGVGGLGRRWWIRGKARSAGGGRRLAAWWWWCVTV